MEVHVWITTGETPLVKAYSIIDTSIKGKPRRNTSIRWNTDPDFSDNVFIFTAPKNATKISVEPAS
jgi:hypothetical protein